MQKFKSIQLTHSICIDVPEKYYETLKDEVDQIITLNALLDRKLNIVKYYPRTNREIISLSIDNAELVITTQRDSIYEVELFLSKQKDSDFKELFKTIYRYDYQDSTRNKAYNVLLKSLIYLKNLL